MYTQFFFVFQVLHCIEKLYRLPVTVQHLKETGVGKTVNALRVYEGTVGDAATALVDKWKLMVVAETSSVHESVNSVPDVHEGNSDNSDSPGDKINANQNMESQESRHSRSSHSSKDNSKSSDNSKSKSSTKEDREKSSKSSEKESSHSRHRSRNEKSEKQSKDSKNDRHSSKKDDGTDSNHRSHKSETKKESSADHHDSHRKRKCKDQSIFKRHEKRFKTSSEDSNEGSEQFFPDVSFDSDDESIMNVDAKSESTESPPSSHREPSSKDNSKREKSRKDKSHHDKHKHSCHKHKSKRHKDHRKSEASKKDDSKSSSSKSGSNQDIPKDAAEKSKEKKSSELKEKHGHREHKDKKSKPKINGHDGIDCNSGISFADALGMCITSIASRKKNCSPPLLTKSVKTELSSSTTATSNCSINTIKTKTEFSLAKEGSRNLLAPNLKLEPLNIDLALTLPEINDNYKPLPTNQMNSNHQRQEEDRVLSSVMYAKNLRTKVYSGNKTSHPSVPLLQDLSIRSFINNIEALKVTGEVPFSIIKPVLERATADQLSMIEHHNPYLIEDTDDLWKFHCNREFRTKQRQEMESWREMYLRCLDEREAKLKTLTANIKQSQSKSLPVRVAKLAYVDNIVKPPRDVLMKQAKYGTGNVASSSDLKKQLITGGPNAATNISVPPPPMGRIKSSTTTAKKVPAPLMAKVLRQVKGRYRR